MQNAGVFIDIDGVVLQGGKPFEWSKKAIHDLWNNEIPFVFVTNGTYSSANLVNNLTNILELPFTVDHVVVAPSPCTSLVDYHNKHVLACCQEDSIDLISELGFTSYITVEELAEIFPELDFVDHNKRKELLKKQMTPERKRAIDRFKPIEAILLLGEPINWECSLQLILDVLMTNGDPRSKFKFVPNPHLPIIACNKDLTFKGAAALPRFGHGAFLDCLESLYMKVTRNELVYTHLMGKPYLVTYDYAANQIQKLAKNGQRIEKFYIIGDNPEVDMQGANLYKEHLQRYDCFSRHQMNESKSTSSKVESILVCTGVYNPQNDLLHHLNNLFRDSQSTRHHGSTSSSGSSSQSNRFGSIDNLNSSDSYLSSSSNRSSEVNLSTSYRRHRPESVPNLHSLENYELKNALSRHNSFISYFDNKYNVPDLTVDNLKDAVEHILNKETYNNF